MTVIRKTILSGAAPQHIRDQTRDITPARLRDLAIELAADPDLRVSVMTGQDGTQELEVLRTGLPHRTEDTVGCQVFTRQVFTRQPPAAPTRTLVITSTSGLQHAVNLIRAASPERQRPPTTGQPLPHPSTMISVGVLLRKVSCCFR